MQISSVSEASDLPDATPKNTLTKAELISLLFKNIGLNKFESKEMVDAFFDEINSALERGDAVRLSGFGNFNVRHKTQRPGRNPRTRESIPVPARRVVTFRASKKLVKNIAERKIDDK